MLRSAFSLSSIALSLALAFPAQAAMRTFVTTAGNDSNPCSNVAPGRSFTAALAITDLGSEIIVLASGGYGAVNINKSVSIIAPDGVIGGIEVSAGNG